MTVKRSVTIAGHRTSISLEQPFWDALCQEADQRGQSVATPNRQRLTPSGPRRLARSICRAHCESSCWKH